MSDPDEPHVEITDIASARHFFKRGQDRSEHGELIRLYESLDEAGRRTLMQTAMRLAQRPDPG